MPTHPFRRAWETRDINEWSAALSDSVVVHSPLIRAPFRGRSQVADLYETIFETFEDVRIEHELTAGEQSAFFWTASVGGDTVDGVDLVRTDAEGKVSEISVYFRPLVSLGAFAAAAGPRIAGRRSRMLGALARPATAPLRLLFRLIDRIATALAGTGQGA
jgi:SnoaL-like protein